MAEHICIFLIMNYISPRKLFCIAHSPGFTDHCNFDLSGICHFVLYLFGNVK